MTGHKTEMRKDRKQSRVPTSIEMVSPWHDTGSLNGRFQGREIEWRDIQSAANVPVYVDMGNISQVPTEAAIDPLAGLGGGGVGSVGNCRAATGLPGRQGTESSSFDQDLAFGGGRDHVLIISRRSIANGVNQRELEATGVEGHPALEEVVDPLG